jgi:hypothetical protein
MTDPQETDSIAAIDAGNPLLLPLLTRPLNLTPAAAFEALDAPDLRAICRILGISLPCNAEKAVILRHIFQHRQQRIDRQLELDVRAAADIELAAAAAAVDDAARAADLLREHEMARAALMDDVSEAAAIIDAPVTDVDLAPPRMDPADPLAPAGTPPDIDRATEPVVPPVRSPRASVDPGTHRSPDPPETSSNRPTAPATPSIFRDLNVSEIVNGQVDQLGLASSPVPSRFVTRESLQGILDARDADLKGFVSS